ncbi:MAG: alpha/beta hydrolase family protein [Paludibacteraceae bacterium]
MRILISLLVFTVLACSKDEIITTELEHHAFVGVKNITYNGVNVNLVIDKPALNEVDALIVYHGTVMYDSLILNASTSLIDKVKTILDRDNMMIVSVAYPEQNLLMGDNIREAEAGLLWVKHKAREELGVTVKKIFLCGHSQGGYLVTRLNTMHATNGVIANGPGPLNLVYRCQLEENRTIPNGITCTLLKNTYGTTTANPTAYMQRSLLNFTTGFKSDILFVQGLKDTPIQTYSWPTFKQDVMNCSTCQNSQFLELTGEGHSALFTSPIAKTEFNTFINSR